MPPSPLLSTFELCKGFGGKPLFENITLTIESFERIGLIGPNGSGKSTLLRMFAGLEDTDSGEIRMRNGLKVTYVAQEDRFEETLTVRETLIQALIEAGEDEHEVSGKVSIVLGRAGFDDHDVLVGKLSGGWRKRLSIARGLVSEPEILLLDEPTNHLDVEGILWLEETLAGAPFALIFVSHDRYFIESLAQRVIELNRIYPKGFFSAQGGYADFIESRGEYLISLQKAKDSLATKVKREVEWLRQGAKARTTKSKHRTAEAGRLIQELSSIKLEQGRSTMEFSSSARKTKDLIKVEQVSKSYGETCLFKNISLTLSPGVRLGIAGVNGSGKTTFVRTLLGQIAPDTGSVTPAKNLRVAFFDQARRQLDRSMTLKEALCRDGDSVLFNGRMIHVMGWASRFLFRADQLSLPIGSLSGGEQARVLLAQIMVEPADILLFDEPTNDLDIGTLEVLEESFLEYPGSIVLVTHDRYMLDRVATHVLGLDGERSALFGDYDQWNRARRTPRNSVNKTTTQSLSELTVRALRLGKLSPQEKKELDGMERKIMKAEAAVEKTQAEMLTLGDSFDTAALQKKCEELAVQQKLTEDLYQRWEELDQRRQLSEGT